MQDSSTDIQVIILIEIDTNAQTFRVRSINFASITESDADY